MKTAIIFTGFVRSFSFYGKKLYQNLFEAFPNADLYFCTWDIVDINDRKKIDCNLFNKFQNCKGITILDWEFHKNLIDTTIQQDRVDDLYHINRFAKMQGIDASNNIRNQWYLVHRAKDLLPRNYYDVIVRTRFDLNYTEFKVDSVESGVTIPYNFFTNHYAKNVDIESGFCDHLAYGTNEDMFIYFDMYNNFNKMYIEDNANISHAEGILKYYLTKYRKVKINMNNNILYQIVKSNDSIDNTPTQRYEFI